MQPFAPAVDPTVAGPDQGWLCKCRGMLAQAMAARLFPKTPWLLPGLVKNMARRSESRKTVIAVNDLTKLRMVDKVVDLCGGSVNGKTVTVLGVTFKLETDDMQEASSLTVVPALLRSGAKVRVVDPHGRKEGEALLTGVRWEADPYLAADGADCIVILTEWNQFRALDLKRLASAMATPVMADLRNVYTRADALAQGFTAYESVGRPGPSIGSEAWQKPVE